MDLIIEFAPWLIGITGTITAYIAARRLKSDTIPINPNSLGAIVTQLQGALDRITELEKKADMERDKRLALEEKLYEYRAIIADLRAELQDAYKRIAKLENGGNE